MAIHSQEIESAVYDNGKPLSWEKKARYYRIGALICAALGLVALCATLLSQGAFIPQIPAVLLVSMLGFFWSSSVASRAARG